MSVLLNVNLLLACGWQSHTKHAAALTWLDELRAFCTCPLVELGFLRVSMGPAFRVSFADAARVLADIKQRSGWSMVSQDVDTQAFASSHFAHGCDRCLFDHTRPRQGAAACHVGCCVVRATMGGGNRI